MNATSKQVLKYWFGDLRNNDYFPAKKAKIWYRPDNDTDNYIRENFGKTWEYAAQKKLDWDESIYGKLALVIVLDQFSRHLFRNSEQSFSQDPFALELVIHSIENNEDRNLYTVEKAMFYMPLQHCEDLNIQEKSLVCYQKLINEAHTKIKEQIEGFYEYALKHYNIIKKFGRFPHRNHILNRISSVEERLYLENLRGKIL